MATDVEARATLDDLHGVEGKAELIGGRIVRYMATGRKPCRIGHRLTASLVDYEERIGRGEAYSDDIGFAVPELSSGRESFSPDASFFFGPFPENEMRFLVGAPTFAAEIRSENDYGPYADRQIAAKRDDYFEAGTLAVWDVDPVNAEIRLYTKERPDQPVVFRRGEIAHAEPALPGWRVEVDRLIRPTAG